MSENFDAVNKTLDEVLAESLKVKLAVAGLAKDVLALRADAPRSDNQTAINALQARAQTVLNSLVGIESDIKVVEPDPVAVADPADAPAPAADAPVADPAPAPAVDAPAAVADAPVADPAPAVDVPVADAGTKVEGALS